MFLQIIKLLELSIEKKNVKELNRALQEKKQNDQLYVKIFLYSVVINEMHIKIIGGYFTCLMSKDGWCWQKYGKISTHNYC